MLPQITSEQIQRWVRILVYAIAGALTQHGFSVDGSTTAAVAGLAVGAANIAWTLYGNRLLARIAELEKSGKVANVVVTDQKLADALPSQKVVSTADAKVVSK